MRKIGASNISQAVPRGHLAHQRVQLRVVHIVEVHVITAAAHAAHRACESLLAMSQGAI
jgi:hypothetical protein